MIKKYPVYAMIKKKFLLGIVILAANIQGQNMNRAILAKTLNDFIGKQSFEIGISVLEPESNTYIGINDTMIMHAASTMKVPVMLELFRRIDRKELKLEDSVEVRNEFRSIVDGSSYSLDINEDSNEILYKLIGEKTTLEHLVNAMISSSSNLATNLLVDLLGAEEIRKTVKLIGADGMTVLRGVEDIKAFRKGLNNRTDARSLTLIFEVIYRKSFISEGLHEKMIDILKGQVFGSGIPAGLPQGVIVAHKTGSISGIYHDSGIVFAERGRAYILTVLTRGATEADSAKKCVSGISRIIYEVWGAGN